MAAEARANLNMCSKSTSGGMTVGTFSIGSTGRYASQDGVHTKAYATVARNRWNGSSNVGRQRLKGKHPSRQRDLLCLPIGKWSSWGGRRRLWGERGRNAGQGDSNERGDEGEATAVGP